MDAEELMKKISAIKTKRRNLWATATIITDPPYRNSHPTFKPPGLMRWATALADASALLDRELVSAYAKRVGLETVRTATQALGDALALAAMGLAEHVEATVTCIRCPLRMGAAVNLEPIYTVGGDVVRALASSRSSIELRTPPEAWTSAPHPHLFEPRGEP